MTFKRYETRLLLYTLALLLTLGFAILLFLKQMYTYELLAIPAVTMVLLNFYAMHRKTQKEIAQFIEAIQYKDFSRNYNEKKDADELLELRTGFNQVNKTFREISKEKETQYQYLQNIMQLVDTGILSYDTESGEVTWMNESLKQLLRIPYLKNIKSLAKRNEHLSNAIVLLQPGTHEVCSILVDKTTSKVLLSATEFKTENKNYKLIAFQNTDQVLDESEANAWQKLLRVMTHEIMNSVAPISSLADTLSKLVAKSSPIADNEDWEDIKTCIDTIKNRSEGLLKFTQTYRNLNTISTPDCREIPVSSLFENIYNLLLPTLEQKNIAFEIVLRDPQMMLAIDISLIEQALINLILNAIDAVKETPHPRITLSAGYDDKNKTAITVTDNGHGISQEILDKIFVPFFTTKKNGNGIGLSLCRQIMMLHKGNIQVQSQTSGTEVSLHF